MKNIKTRILFTIGYFIMWLFYFIAARACFLIYYSDRSSEFSPEIILHIFLEGLKLDLSMTSYLCIIPFLAIALSFWIPEKIINRFIKYYTNPVVIIINLLMLFDIGLYEYWGIRLDVTPFIYLDTPTEMFASLSVSQLLLAILIWIIVSLSILYAFNRMTSVKYVPLFKDKFWYFLSFLALTASLGILIRGGLGNSPINQSDVYFSDNMFANHAAVNFAWNFNHSLNLKSYEKVNPFIEFSDTDANSIFSTIRTPLSRNDSTNFPGLRTNKPNVILIIWESLTAKLVEPIGGEPEVTHYFNELVREGILFENFYANADRSDKGLVSILSGYYPQPHKSIIKLPNKTRNLPMLPKKLAELGYKTSFYYGGTLNFMNMNTYLRNGGISKYTDRNSFQNSEIKSKWGVHDDILLSRLAEDLKNNPSQPFFDILFTLSSHNPYDFEGDFKFGKDSEENKFRSSHAFTDLAVHDFMEFAKKQPWWNNTIVIIMADHGNPLPVHEGEFNSPLRFHIPMLWTGGALIKKDTIISTYCTQTDFAYSLLDLLGGDTNEFKWGKNIFNTLTDDFAYYNFNKGFGAINENGYVVYDYTVGKLIDSSGYANQDLLMLGKAITQITYQDFLDQH